MPLSNVPKRDNNTLSDKIALRRTALSLLTEPAVAMETHGGLGDIYSAVYTDIPEGIVFEKVADKAQQLAEQRPTWAVYEADCEITLNEGAGNHLCVNFLDIDPYGQCWDTLRAFFFSERPFADRMIVVVNCGLRMRLSLGVAHMTYSMEKYVEKYGNDLYPVYLEICREELGEIVGATDYQIVHFDGYYCGNADVMTHFFAVLEK